MAYVIPTADDLQAAYPEFAAVADGVITPKIAAAVPMVSTDWTEADYTLGIMLYAAHTLSLGGSGTTIATQLAGFKRLKLGPLDIELASAPAGTEAGSLEATPYGVQYLAVAARNAAGGPFIV